jgi:hypothetical protein
MIFFHVTIGFRHPSSIRIRPTCETIWEIDSDSPEETFLAKTDSWISTEGTLILRQSFSPTLGRWRGEQSGLDWTEPLNQEIGRFWSIVLVVKERKPTVQIQSCLPMQKQKAGLT